MPKYIAQFEKKLEKVEEQETLRHEKQKQLVEEAYDYFGYKVRKLRFIIDLYLFIFLSRM